MRAHRWRRKIGSGKAKANLKHGEFKAWIETNIDCSYSHATRYMTLAKGCARATFDPGTSIRQALKQIAPPKPSKAEAPCAIAGEGEGDAPAVASLVQSFSRSDSAVDRPAAVADDDVTAPETAEVGPAEEHLATAGNERSAKAVAGDGLEAVMATQAQVRVSAEADQQTLSEARVPGAFAALKSAVEDAPAMPERERDAIRFLDALADVFDHARVLDPAHVGAASEQSVRSGSEQEVEERFDRMIGEARALGWYLHRAKQAAIVAWRRAARGDEGVGIGNDAHAPGEDLGTGLAAGDAEISAPEREDPCKTTDDTRPEGEEDQRKRTTPPATGVPEDRADTLRSELDLFVRDFHERYGTPIPMKIEGQLRGASVEQLDRIRNYLKAYLTPDGDPLRVLGNAIERAREVNFVGLGRVAMGRRDPKLLWTSSR